MVIQLIDIHRLWRQWDSNIVIEIGWVLLCRSASTPSLSANCRLYFRCGIDYSKDDHDVLIIIIIFIVFTRVHAVAGCSRRPRRATMIDNGLIQHPFKWCSVLSWTISAVRRRRIDDVMQRLCRSSVVAFGWLENFSRPRVILAR